MNTRVSNDMLDGESIVLDMNNAEHGAHLTPATVAERVPDLIEPSTTKAIESQTNNAEHGADLSAAPVAKKVPGQTSDNSRSGAPHTTAAKKRSGKRKRTVVDDTDVEDSAADGPAASGEIEDDLKPEQRRRKKRERQSEKDDDDTERLDDKLDPDKEAEIISAIGTRREGETLGEHQTRVYTFISDWCYSPI